MCNKSLFQTRFNNLTEPFSTFQLLGLRNRHITPCSATDSPTYYISMKNSEIQRQQEASLLHNYDTERAPSISPILDVMESSTLESLPTCTESKSSSILRTEHDSIKSQNIQFKSIEESSLINNSNNHIFPLPNLNVLPLSGAAATLINHETTLPTFDYLTPRVRNLSPVDFPLVELNRVGSIFPSFLHRRPRGEKRPIPEEQKDDKYYERRKRNNEAAKKSRDARKIREDRIAFRAAFLEQENSILRAQVIALRDELQAMRQIIGRNCSNQI